MSNATDIRNTYRRTRTGKWAVMGTTANIFPGARVEVHTKAGKVKHEMIIEIGRPFEIDGIEMVYGYNPDNASLAALEGVTYPCDECGHEVHLNTMCRVGGFRH